MRMFTVQVDRPAQDQLETGSGTAVMGLEPRGLSTVAVTSLMNVRSPARQRTATQAPSSLNLKPGPCFGPFPERGERSRCQRQGLPGGNCRPAVARAGLL